MSAAKWTRSSSRDPRAPRSTPSSMPTSRIERSSRRCSRGRSCSPPPATSSTAIAASRTCPDATRRGHRTSDHRVRRRRGRAEARSAARGGRGQPRDRAASRRWNGGAGLHHRGPVRGGSRACLPRGDGPDRTEAPGGPGGHVRAGGGRARRSGSGQPREGSVPEHALARAPQPGRRDSQRGGGAGSDRLPGTGAGQDPGDHPAPGATSRQASRRSPRCGARRPGKDRPPAATHRSGRRRVHRVRGSSLEDRAGRDLPHRVAAPRHRRRGGRPHATRANDRQPPRQRQEMDGRRRPHLGQPPAGRPGRGDARA